jgi:8-oxo-dGTP pyrophosphatase MutT (NUDIX family)
VGYIRHFDACNRHDLTQFVPFYFDGVRFGRIEKNLAALLSLKTAFFQQHEQGLALADDGGDFASRSKTLHAISQWIAAHYNIRLRGEMYPVIAEWGDRPLAQIDRAAVPWFGIRAFGVHINGFVRKPDGLHLWIGERAADRLIDPGKLDNLVGGGQPIGLTLEENLCKEAQEEAGIDAALTKQSTLVSKISYLTERHKGLRSDTLYIYDLELPESFMPRNTDGEVAAFYLLPLAEVAKIVHDTERFKFNCNLVIIDFMLRYGFIATNHPEYDRLKHIIE